MNFKNKVSILLANHNSNENNLRVQLKKLIEQTELQLC